MVANKDIKISRLIKITIEAKDPKHERRLRRWAPFIRDAFESLRAVIPRKAKLPAEITLKTLKARRLPGTDVSLCLEWGMMGHTWDKKWWLAMAMDADTYKFRNTLLHEIAHFGAIAMNNNWKHDSEWAAILKKLRKEMSKLS